MSRKARLDVEVDGDSTGAVRAADRTSRAYRDLGRDLDGVDRRARSAAGKGGGLGGLAGGLGAAAGTAAVAGGALVAAGGAAYYLANAASDAGEAQSAASAVFKDSYSAIEKAAGGAAKTVGLSRTQYLDAAKTVGVLGNAAGLTGKDLSSFSTDIVGAAGDLASFNNTSVDDALLALQSGLRGEAEPLRRFGILLDDATLKAEAMRLGLLKPTKDAGKIAAAQARLTIAQRALNEALREHGPNSTEVLRAQAALSGAQGTLQKATQGSVGTLTTQQKTLAAQSVIMSQLGAAQGDFARTSGGLANQQRILQAQVGDVTAELGQKLLPIGLKVVTWLNDAVPRTLELASAVGKELGPYLAAGSKLLSAFSGSGAKTSAATKTFGDVLTIATATTRSFVGFVRGAATPVINGLRSATDSVRSALERNPKAMAAVQAALRLVGSAMSQAGTVGRALGSVVGGILGGAFKLIGSAIGRSIDLVDSLIGIWQRASSAISGAASRIRSALSNLPGGDLLGRVLGTGGPTLVTASGGRGGAPLFARAAGGTGALPQVITSRTGSAVVVASSITNTYTITVEGAIDPVSVVDQLRRLMADAERRDGRR